MINFRKWQTFLKKYSIKTEINTYAIFFKIPIRFDEIQTNDLFLRGESYEIQSLGLD